MSLLLPRRRLFTNVAAMGKAGAASPPVATFLSGQNATAGASTSTSSFTSSASPGRMIAFSWVCNEGFDVAMSTVTITPNVGNANQACTLVENVHGLNNQNSYGIGYGVLDSSADTATSFVINLNWASNPFNPTWVYAWSVPSANVSSLTPTGHANAFNAAATSSSVSLATLSGGFVIMMANSGATNYLTNVGTAGGTETYTTDANTPISAAVQLAGHANGIATNASSAVTATYTLSDTIQMVAAAWR